MQVERNYFNEMKNYLKDEVGLKSLLYGTADFSPMRGPAYPMVWSNSALDFLGGHMYWQHANIEGRVISPVVNSPGFSSVLRLSRTAVAGKPHLIPEVNHPFPNFYDSEDIQIISAYGSFQDWWEILNYTFEPEENPEYDSYIANDQQ